MRQCLLALALAMLTPSAIAFGRLTTSDRASGHRATHDASADAPSLGVERCPVKLGGHAGPARQGGVSMTVANERGGNLELLYFDGASERRYWAIDARGEFSIGTRAGDRWRLRTKTGELAAEIEVGSEARQHYAVPHCLDEIELAAAAESVAHDVAAPSATDLLACSPWAHLSSSEPSPGMHVICPSYTDAPEGARARFDVFADGWTGGAARERRPPPSHSIAVPGQASGSVESLATLVMRRLATPARGSLHQPPAFFTPLGVRLRSAEDVLAASCVLLFEGGMWVWPAVEVGHELNLTVGDGAADRRVRLSTLSLWPRVLLAEDFLTPAEAELIVSRADGHMHKSGVSLKEADRGKSSSDYRTSSQWSYPLWDEAILPLDRRVQQLTRIPMTHAEQIQVLRYLPNEHYTAHHDFFDPGEYSGRDRESGYASNRLLTVFFYLSEPEEGGETGFPRAGKLPQPRDFLDCSRGLAVKPQRLAVLLFYSMLPNGEFDQTSLHTGCDVKEGVKWSANFWFWNSVSHLRPRRPAPPTRSPLPPAPSVQVQNRKGVALSQELERNSTLRFERSKGAR